MLLYRRMKHCSEVAGFGRVACDGRMLLLVQRRFIQISFERIAARLARWTAD